MFVRFGSRWRWVIRGLTGRNLLGLKDVSQNIPFAYGWLVTKDYLLRIVLECGSMILRIWYVFFVKLFRIRILIFSLNVLSLEVWRGVKHQVEFYGFYEKWDDILECFSQKRGPKKLEHCLALAASVYFIWRERNRRIFQGKCRPTSQVIRDICDATLKRMAWKTLLMGNYSYV